MKTPLRWITENTAYIPAPVNTGILRFGDEAVIIDTGLDRDHAIRIIRTLETEKLKPIMVINTHSHADHCGGNHVLQKRLNVPIAAPALEKPFIEDPYLESFGLFGAAHPPAALQNKFLKAKPSLVSHVFSPDEQILAFGDGFSLTLIPLPGHSPQQTGIIHDGILFSADAFLGIDYLDKHLIPFNSNVALHRSSLQRLKEIEMELCIPGHGTPLKNLSEIIERNEAALDLIDAFLLDAAVMPATLDELLSRFCLKYQVGLETISQYHLYRTAFAAHLSALSETGRIKYLVTEATFKWQSINGDAKKG
jgi:glyoxylase-like metal-dependent hydrolase (beta-lactamase superfamily II)